MHHKAKERENCVVSHLQFAKTSIFWSLKPSISRNTPNKIFRFLFYKCLVLKTKTLKFFPNFYGIYSIQLRYDTIFECLVVVMQFSVILRISKFKILESLVVCHVQNQANFEGLCNTPNIFFYICLVLKLKFQYSEPRKTVND